MSLQVIATNLPQLPSRLRRDVLLRLLVLATAAVLLASSAADSVRGEDSLKYRLLSHLQDVAEEVEPLRPIRKNTRPRRLQADDEILPYSGPPTEIDGPEVLPLTPDIMLDPNQYQAESPIGMEHPLLGDPVMRDGMAHLSSHRNGFFQKLSLTATWLPEGDAPPDMGFAEIDTFASFALPFPISAWPLVITPGFNMHLLSGPQSSDMPARLYDTYFDFMWLPTFVNRYTLLVAVTPGYYSDFQVSDADAFRVTGKGLVIYDAVPDRLQLVAGVLYLGRDNLKMLPVGGAIWTPTDFLRLELIFPKPKVAVCINAGEWFQDWIYTTAEYGGNTYSIERTSGAHDKVTLQDFRILLGAERKLNGGTGYSIEAGYVFGRRVTYLSGGGFEPGDTLLLRAGVVF